MFVVPPSIGGHAPRSVCLLSSIERPTARAEEDRIMMSGINVLLISAIGLLLVVYLLRRRTRIITAKLRAYYAG